jgi:hypothetical protein
LNQTSQHFASIAFENLEIRAPVRSSGARFELPIRPLDGRGVKEGGEFVGGWRRCGEVKEEWGVENVRGRRCMVEDDEGG